MRARGLVERLQQLGHEVVEYGDLVVERREAGQQDRLEVMDFNRKTAARVEQVLREGRFCLTLGGDHSGGLGTVSGHLAADPEVPVYNNNRFAGFR